jgi:hypothetical protein
MSNEFDLGGPSAGGRPARRMNSASRGLRPTVGLRRPGRRLASAEADAWRGAPERADFNRRERPSANGRPARRMNSASRGLRPMVGLRRPGEDPFCVGGGRRLARSARRGRFQSASKASGRRSACADRKSSFASAEADAWRGAPEEVDFNRRQRPLADGRPARRMNSASRGLRPTVGLRRPGRRLASAEADAWRGAPEEADFNRRQRPSAGGRPARRMNSASRGLWPVVGLRRPGEDPFCVGGGRRLARSA